MLFLLSHWGRRRFCTEDAHGAARSSRCQRHECTYILWAGVPVALKRRVPIRPRHGSDGGKTAERHPTRSQRWHTKSWLSFRYDTFALTIHLPPALHWLPSPTPYLRPASPPTSAIGETRVSAAAPSGAASWSPSPMSGCVPVRLAAASAASVDELPLPQNGAWYR